ETWSGTAARAGTAGGRASCQAGGEGPSPTVLADNRVDPAQTSGPAGDPSVDRWHAGGTVPHEITVTGSHLALTGTTGSVVSVHLRQDTGRSSMLELGKARGARLDGIVPPTRPQDRSQAAHRGSLPARTSLDAVRRKMDGTRPPAVTCPPPHSPTRPAQYPGPTGIDNAQQRP
ncbi:hypothetical protein ACFQ07_02655, partial [Actinomadura adrarensis]